MSSSAILPSRTTPTWQAIATELATVHRVSLAHGHVGPLGLRDHCSTRPAYHKRTGQGPSGNERRPRSGAYPSTERTGYLAGGTRALLTRVDPQVKLKTPERSLATATSPGFRLARLVARLGSRSLGRRGWFATGSLAGPPGTPRRATPRDLLSGRGTATSRGAAQIERDPRSVPKTVALRGPGRYPKDTSPKRECVVRPKVFHLPKLDTARPRHCHPVAPSLPPLCNTCSIVDTPTAQIAPESDPDKPRCHSQ